MCVQGAEMQYPLITAVRSQNVEACKLIIQHGAYIFVQNNFEQTVFDLVCNFHDDGTREQHQIVYLLGRADAALRASERSGQLKKSHL